jgi:mannosyl-oligosaccharide alpha-1,2-mannosidase
MKFFIIVFLLCTLSLEENIALSEDFVTIGDYGNVENDSLDTKNQFRRLKIRTAMKHAYQSYETNIHRDEIRPITHQYLDWVTNGMAMTAIDSLDTLYIMGMKEEFQRAVKFISEELRQFKDIDHDVSVFETTIRVLGGLLSAYELSGENSLLEKAKQIADRLLPAFESNTGVPYAHINLKTGSKRKSDFGCAVLAEFGTLQLEFRRLSQLTGDIRYDQVVTRVMNLIEFHSRYLNRIGLYPAFFNLENNMFCNEHVTLGAYGDSFYEYLLKQWIMSKEERYRNLFQQSAQGITKFLLVKPAKHWFIAELYGNNLQNKVDHLICFASGMFALAHLLNATTSALPHDLLEIAKELGQTCYETYRMTASGLSPDSFHIDERTGNIIPRVKRYILRPETIESLFVLYRVTEDEKYREYGWQIFEAIERHCKVQFGYSGIGDTTTLPVSHDDHQQSFFLAETLKYLYLLFSPKSLLPLDEWVFNTEAHPLRIKPLI